MTVPPPATVLPPVRYLRVGQAGEIAAVADPRAAGSLDIVVVVRDDHDRSLPPTLRALLCPAPGLPWEAYPLDPEIPPALATALRGRPEAQVLALAAVARQLLSGPESVSRLRSACLVAWRLARTSPPLCGGEVRLAFLRHLVRTGRLSR